ncbi:MAG: ATP-binding cassette domain-containing protein [archaeon]|nr:ATP-binding cassette domain-containing protein [archaeon]
MTMEQNDTLLEIKNLFTYFFTEEGVVKAVDGISLEIKRNQVMGLVGETGCGKSVSALSILKLIRNPGEIVNGDIVFNNHNLASLDKKEIRSYRGNTITMIFQDPLNSLNPVFRVGKQISEVFLLHQRQYLEEELSIARGIQNEKKQILKDLKNDLKEIDDKIKLAIKNQEEISEEIAISKKVLNTKIQDLKNQIKRRINISLFGFRPVYIYINKRIKVHDIALRESARMLTSVGIADSEQLLNRFPHELSGGMRQRVMISMGLACHPELLICDEPTTALDVTIQAQILELIRKLKAKFKSSILFITHDLGVIYELCETVAVMYSGNIVEFGTVKDIMEKPLHPYTQGLLASIPRVNPEDRKNQLRIIPGLVPNLIFPPTGCRFHPRCEYSMKICKDSSPKLTIINGRKISCHLFHPDKDNEKMEKQFTLLTKEEKEEFL